MAIQDLTASLDLKQNLNVFAPCKQFDSLNLILSIYDDSLQADLSNYDVRLRAMKADKVPLIQEHIGITINSNIVNIEADEQLTTTAGKTPIEIQFINKSTGKKKATFNLVLVVVPSTLEVNASISTATYTLLEELENKLDQASDFFENIDEAITANTNLINSTNTANSSKQALDDSNTTALSTKSALDTSNTNATNTKNELDILNTTATNTKNALDLTNTTGQSLLNSLETFEQEHEDVTDISNQLANIDADLSQNTQNIADTTKYSRHFKSKFGVPPFWGANSEYPTLPTREKILSDLTTIKEYGIDEISIIVHIDDSVSNNVPLHAVENIDDMEYAYEQAMLLGINVGMIKFHLWFDDADFINNASAYEIDYKNLITTWATRFQGKNIPYFTILNEVNYIYGNSTYEQFVVECLNIPKSYGFKTSISTVGTKEMLKLSDNIKNNLDAFFINCYPMVSYKLKNTTINDSIHAWDLDLLNIKFLKQTYSNKPIIISETGCQDYYESLCNPGDSTWKDKGYSLTNGKAPYVFLKGLFLSDLQNYVERVHYWFNEALYYDNVKELIHEYTNGGN